MKRILLQAFAAALLLLSITRVSAEGYDFSVQYKDGTIYYNILKGITSLEVEVTAGRYTGTVIIPASVDYQNKTYIVTTIGEDAFYGNNYLFTVSIPNTVRFMGMAPFAACDRLTSIEVDTDNPYYMSDAQGLLYNKTQTELIQCPAGKTGNVTIPNSVTTIGEWAFKDCDSLTAITIPNFVTTIAKGAFSNCDSLTAVTIGTAVSIISNWAFSGCTDLTALTILAETPPELGENVFEAVSEDIPVHVLCESVEVYQEAFGWNAFTDYSDCLSEIDNIETYTVATAGSVVYPNPVEDAIRIVLPENTTQASFRLYDMQGRLLLEQMLTTNDNKVWVAHLSSGMYLYNIDVNGKRQMGKIVKW